MNVLRGVILLFFLLSCGGERNIDEDYRDEILNGRHEQIEDEGGYRVEESYNTSLDIYEASRFNPYKICLLYTSPSPRD